MELTPIAPKEKEINGNKYTYRNMPTSAALRVFSKMIKVLGPALAAAQSGGHSQFAVYAMMLEKMDDQMIESIVNQLVAHAEINGKPLKPMYEMYFADKFMELLEFVQFAFEAQFADFLAKALGRSKA